MQPVGSIVAFVNLYQIPEGSNPIRRRKYVKSHEIFYVFSTVTGFRQRNIFESVSDFFRLLL